MAYISTIKKPEMEMPIWVAVSHDKSKVYYLDLNNKWVEAGEVS